MAFCMKCGVKLDDSARFCNSCGAAVPAEMQTAASQPVSAPKAAPVPVKKPINWTVLLIMILVGVLVIGAGAAIIADVMEDGELNLFGILSEDDDRNDRDDRDDDDDRDNDDDDDRRPGIPGDDTSSGNQIVTTQPGPNWGEDTAPTIAPTEPVEMP